MAKIKTRRGYRFVKELGGAIRHSTVSFGAQWLVEHGHVFGRVLDFGSGFGSDADHFNWEAYDPHYRQRELSTDYDTVVCNHVLNMLTQKSRSEAIRRIQNLLSQCGTAFLIVPRNIPSEGKVALRKRIQNYVILSLPTVYVDGKLEIYQLRKTSRYEDLTNEIEYRLAQS